VTGRTFGPIIRFVNTQNRQNVIKFSAESGARKAAPSFEIRFNIVNCVQNFVIPFCQFRWKREWEWGVLDACNKIVVCKCWRRLANANCNCSPHQLMQFCVYLPPFASRIPPPQCRFNALQLMSLH